MSKQWGTIVAIILIGIVAFFAIINVESVPVNFGFGVVAWPLIMIILGSLLIGALATVLISMGTTFKNKKELKNAKKELDNAENDKEEAIARVRTEQNEILAQKDLIISEKTDKINSLERELVNRMTQSTANAAKQSDSSLN
ncbi:LapA family protein [Carnobacterium pleistocenium]|uniref:LapA family protein n=1 Tax=Carnobacterium pleistocenium TaxID=181073 RepID=UPI0005567FD5|nr:LapA family protein [Carnobacterium pleistocenium]